MKTISAYYNEFDPRAAAWLRQLIKNGCITQGEVDERSITEISASDIIGFDRVHFFAGIGTWDYCLNQSGWGDKPVWTASLPCQPFSVAGKGLGKSDERHLLPHFLELVRQCKPDAILGEQVGRAIAHGWLDDLQANMEAEGYAVGSIIIGAHSVGAAHIRQRLYWVGHSSSERCGEERSAICECQERSSDASTAFGRMGNAEHDGRAASQKPGCTLQTSEGRREEVPDIPGESTGTGRPDPATNLSGCEERQGIYWIYCRDGKYRPIEPGIPPLVDGATRTMGYSGDPSEPINANATQEARVMRLRGYGNAIQAQTAILFIKSYISILKTQHTN